MSRPILQALAALAGALLAAGCGSRAVADYPPPATVPRAPAPIADLPGEVRSLAGRVDAERPVGRLDRRRSTLTIGGRTVPTPLEPTSAARVPNGPILVVGGRERMLAAYDPVTLRELGRVPAGVGPSNVVGADDGLAYVADTTAGALLVYRTTPELAPVRRTIMPGAPWALAYDAGRDRVWVTIPGRNRVVGFAAEERTNRIQGFGTVRQPNAVRMEGGDVVVLGDRELQVIDPDRD